MAKSQTLGSPLTFEFRFEELIKPMTEIAKGYEKMTDFRRTLDNLARTFTVREIMIPVGQLVRARDDHHAHRLLHEYPDFDMIPIPEMGEPTQFLDRQSNVVQNIDRENLLSDGTSILDLIDALATSKRGFVLVGQKVGGYVHFSDLNEHVVKIPLFAVFESLENLLASKLNDTVKESELPGHLDRQSLVQVTKRLGRLRRNRANLDWTSALSFRQVLEIAANAGIITADSQGIDNLVQSRNKAAHAVLQLVEKFSDVLALARAKQLCLELLANAGITN